MACPLSWAYERSVAVTRTASDMEKIMRKVTATLAIIIAVIGVIVLMPALPFIASAGILLLIAAGLAEMSKHKKSDADTQA